MTIVNLNLNSRQSLQNLIPLSLFRSTGLDKIYSNSMWVCWADTRYNRHDSDWLILCFFEPFSLHPNIFFLLHTIQQLRQQTKADYCWGLGPDNQEKDVERASGRKIGENVDCLLVFSCSSEFFNNCQQSVVLRNSLTKKLFLMFLYLEVSLKKFAQHYFYFASSREGWQMASCRNFGSGIKTKLVLQFSKGARKCLFNLSNLKLSFHAGKSVRGGWKVFG